MLIENELRAGVSAGNIRRNVSVPATARVIYSFLRGQMAFSAFDRGLDVGSTVEEFIAALRAHLVPRARERTSHLTWWRDSK